jgi:redox-sensitive bicupin YhaK (pirin superfamily)
VIDVRRAGTRFHSSAAGIESWYSFSFGPHHDPANSHFGQLIAHNDELLQAGAGFDPHPHREIEIVTWVLSGHLEHSDSAGHRAVTAPGVVQRLSAGTGVEHAERNAARAATGDDAARPVHFVQMWVPADERGLRPAYEQVEFDDAALTGRLVPIASGLAQHADTAATRLRNPRAGLSVARLSAGESVQLPDAPRVHLFVARGRLWVEEQAEGHDPVAAGDVVRFVDAGARRVAAVEPAELLVWELAGDAFG